MAQFKLARDSVIIHAPTLPLPVDYYVDARGDFLQGLQWRGRPRIEAVVARYRDRPAACSRPGIERLAATP